jgi:hypothetical protein
MFFLYRCKSWIVGDRLKAFFLPGDDVVSTEKLARGTTNDLILSVQYLVLDAIFDVFCTWAFLVVFI